MFKSPHVIAFFVSVSAPAAVVRQAANSPWVDGNDAQVSSTPSGAECLQAAGRSIHAITLRRHSSEYPSCSSGTRAEFGVADSEAHFGPFENNPKVIEDELGFEPNWLAVSLQTLQQVFGQRVIGVS